MALQTIKNKTVIVRCGSRKLSETGGYYDKRRVEIAKWIHENIGGNIKLLTAVNEQNKKTADYLWNGKLWDLKSITTEKSADSSIRKGVKQIADNPGGIILNYVGKSLDLGKLKEFAINRLNRSQVLDIEVIAVKDSKIIFVISNK